MFWGKKKTATTEAPEGLKRLEEAHQRRDQVRTRDRRGQLLANTGTGFQGAKRDRITDQWNPMSLSPSAIHRMDSSLLRNRARDLVANNPLAKSGVDTYIANVVECGITPKPLFDDSQRRRTWMSAWDHWGENEADITGSQHFYELMALWLEEVIVGGGCLAHYRTIPRGQDRRRRIPLAVDLIPEERFVDDKDDFVQFRNRRKSTNPIVRGIEVDVATGAATGYWVKNHDRASSSAGNDPADPVRLPANQCQYAFFKKRIGQYRGVTLLHAAVLWLWKLGYYTDNELMASAIKSCYAAIIKQSPEDVADFPDLLDGDPDGPVVDSYGNALEKIQPGIIARMTVPGDITGVGPNVPTSDTIGWVIFIERCISVALNLSFEEVTRDYSKGNFSSTRASANADRKRFRPMQKFVVNHFCMPAYGRFAEAASMRGVDGFPTIDEFAANIDQWLGVRWRAPGWASVNPWDDARAAVLEIENGMGTREDYLASRGKDWEETIVQLGSEESAIAEQGLAEASIPLVLGESETDTQEQST